MSVAIKVENLGKKYLIRHEQQTRYRYQSLGESISRSARDIGKRLLHPFAATPPEHSEEEFWALKNINFEVNHGDRVGIIGRNGAGKSTLLKILSRITHPTTGIATINGRVSSLLEVGTGFHPELTGRENIFLNGAILGMRKHEIQKQFDEIVDFSEVEKFLDTPVKHYSSGMYVRLAFSVAAHLETEILVVDEVLAVGDAEFQKKCLGKMEKSTNDGKTILFVSHNIASIRRLCKTGILLNGGESKLISGIENVISEYLTLSAPITNHFYSKNDFTSPSKNAFIYNVSILNAAEQICGTFHIGETLKIRLSIKRNKQKQLKAAIELRCNDGLKIANIINTDCNHRIESLQEEVVLQMSIDDIRLYPGTYNISAWIGSLDSLETYDYASECTSFEIASGGALTTRNLPRHDGLFFFTPKWSNL